MRCIRVAWVRMGALCRPGTARGALALSPHLPHEARHTLMVHRDIRASQEGDDASVAIGRPLPRQALDRRVQCRLSTGASPIVIRAARLAHHATSRAHRLVCAEHLDDLVLDLGRSCKILVACLKMSFARVKRPTSCSG
jgi:hypothetical protein